MDRDLMPPPKGFRPVATPDPAFARLKELVIGRTGHFYYQEKDDALWERVRRRLQAARCPDCAAYLERLHDPALGPVEWAALEAEITIGETFFFRYAEQFAALRRTILPDIIERNRGRRRLRIWSAGCATGAEPYSVAITLRELLGTDIESWRLSIVGTDINEGFLATARRGRFGKWALRSTPPQDRGRYFVPPDEGSGWVLRPEYRALVRFERHNLMSLVDGTSPLHLTDFDLVLCRNVLIYFSHEMVVRIVRELGQRLAHGGWLLVGHAEPNPAFAEILAPVSLPGTAAYRRLEDAGEAAPSNRPETEGSSPPAAWEPLLPPAAPPPREDRMPGAAAGQSPPAQASGRPVADGPARPADDLVAAVVSKADAGELEGARAACREGLLADPTNARLHFYDGVIAAAIGLHDAAEDAFRKALYIDKAFVMAHYHLGLLLIERGRRDLGRRCIANAAGLASSLPENAELPEGDGMTAGMLRDNARLTLGRAAEGLFAKTTS